MPSTSSKQARFMQAVKHSPKFAKKVGVSQSVGADFVAADKAAGKYEKGGSVVDVGDPARRGARTTWRRDVADVGDVVGAFSDMVTGAARGAAKAAIGWPGDIERLMGTQLPAALSAAYSAPSGERLGASATALESTAKSPTLFPTMEEVGNVLPAATRFSMRSGQTNPFESIAEFAPVSPAQVGKAAKFGASKARQIADLAAQPTSRRQLQRGAIDAGTTSGERGISISASQEGINRAAQERAAKQMRVLVDKDGTTRELIGVDAVDQQAGPGQVILQRGLGGPEWTVLSQGENVGLSGIARARGKLKGFGMAGGGSIASLLRAIAPKLSKTKAPLTQVAEEARVPLAEMVRTEGAAMRYPPAQRGAVRLKGGNFNEPRLSEYLGSPESTKLATQEWAYTPPTDVTPDSIAQWKTKQLANYLRKDIGSPTDPLLQVEKEYPDLHLPEGAMGFDPDKVSPRYQNTHDSIYRAAGLPTQPITPWSRHSDTQLSSMNPKQYSKELLAGQNWRVPAPEAPEWLKKLPEDAKIWGLGDQYSDELGFGHVMDYLNAARTNYDALADRGGVEAVRGAMAPRIIEDALRLHDAGLTLSPEQISRTSVADAVRKTAQWNEFMAKTQEASPDLAKGIKAVHKEYPEEGMKWVELGVPEVPKDYQLPEGFKVAKTPSGNYGVQQKTEAGHYKMAADEAETPEKAVAKYYGEQELTAGLNAEGKAMGHCVGGYCDEVTQRGTKIYSLRDAKGNPHVTVEVKSALGENPSKALERWERTASPEELRSLYTQHTEYKAANDAAGNSSKSPAAWAHAKGLLGTPPLEIVQIKGKQNAAPVEKYLPFVQDFVKNGKWGKVGDLKNTGLIEHSGRYWSKPELEEAALKYGKVGNANWARSKDLLSHSGVDEERARAEFLSNFTQDQRGNFGPKATLELPEGFASGGSVKSRALTLVDEEMDPIERLGHMCDVAMTE
jgi:PcfJ-like protein